MNVLGRRRRASMRRRSTAWRIISEDSACTASEEEIDRAKKRPVKSTLEISRACVYLASDVNPFSDNRARWSLNRNKLRSPSLFPALLRQNDDKTRFFRELYYYANHLASVSSARNPSSFERQSPMVRFSRESKI